MNTRIAIPVALPSLLVATLLAGCSDDTPVDSAAPAAGAAGATASSAPSSAAPSANESAGGCPVTADTLDKALQANPGVASAIVLGKGFKDVSCYQGWATAVAQPTNLEAAVVLFKYDAAKKTWAAVSGGTDGVCRDNVPENVATHLAGCRN